MPLVDANMRELKETGWMSNRGTTLLAFTLHTALLLSHTTSNTLTMLPISNRV